MKKIYLFFAILFAINTFGNQYVPLVTENAEWQVLYTSYPYQFQMARTTIQQLFTLHGDTIIANQTYKKICLKINRDGQPGYIYFGAIREQDKRIYYIGNGYYTSSSDYNVSAAKIKAMKDCLWSHNFDGQEVLLYDFNSKSGDTVQWGYRYMKVMFEDTVLVGNSYRRCLHMSDNDKIVEGIGSVINGMLSFVTPIPTCSDYYNVWEFDAYITNGAIAYKSTKNRPILGYQTVYSNRKAYYTTIDQKIETLKIDSCVFFNDSILYPSRTLQLIGDECYDPNGGGWAGKKIVLSNQWNYFFNEDNDTIKIKTDAVLNESWTLFKRTDITIAATVTKWDTTTTMGMADTVKTITLHVFDRSMKPLPHELENATLKISKHFGLTKTLNFTYFPALKYITEYYVPMELELIGITNPELGVQNMNWFDVFDFQVGDEFHYIESSNYLVNGGSAWEKKQIIRILTRENFNDSIHYTEDVQLIQKYKQNAQSNYVTTSEHYQTGFWVQKNTAFEQEPGIPIFNNDSTRIEIYTAFNSVSRRDIYTKNNGCWIRSNIIDDACNYVSYAKGRGLIHSSSGCWLMSGESLDQVYYKKGAETGGTPLILTGNEELNARYSVNIYPNPTTDKIYIDLNDNIHCTFELFDAQGKFMLQKELNQKQNSVNMQEFNKGMYFYRVKTDEKQVKTGKIFRE